MRLTCSAPSRDSPPPAELPGLPAAAAGGCAPGRHRPEKLVVRAPLSARSKRAREAAKRRGHGLGEPLLLPGTYGPAVRAGAARVLPAPRVPDARLHQPLGSQNRRRLPGGQPHRQQVRLHQHRTGNDRVASPRPRSCPGKGGVPFDIALLVPFSPSFICAVAAVALTLERCSFSPSLSFTHIYTLTPPKLLGFAFCLLVTCKLRGTGRVSGKTTNVFFQGGFRPDQTFCHGKSGSTSSRSFFWGGGAGVGGEHCPGAGPFWFLRAGVRGRRGRESLSC